MKRKGFGFVRDLPQYWPTLEEQVEADTPAIVAVCRAVLRGAPVVRTLGQVWRPPIATPDAADRKPR